MIGLSWRFSHSFPTNLKIEDLKKMQLKLNLILSFLSNEPGKGFCFLLRDISVPIYFLLTMLPCTFFNVFIDGFDLG
jgi:hypothetical protein